MDSALSQTNSFGGTLSCQMHSCRTLPHEHYLATEKSNPPPVNPHYTPPPSDHQMEVLQPVAQSDAHIITMELGNIEGVVSDTTVHAYEGDVHVTMPFTLLFP